MEIFRWADPPAYLISYALTFAQVETQVREAIGKIGVHILQVYLFIYLALALELLVSETSSTLKDRIHLLSV